MPKIILFLAFLVVPKVAHSASAGGNGGSGSYLWRSTGTAIINRDIRGGGILIHGAIYRNLAYPPGSAFSLDLGDDQVNSASNLRGITSAFNSAIVNGSKNEISAIGGGVILSGTEGSEDGTGGKFFIGQGQSNAISSSKTNGTILNGTSGSISGGGGYGLIGNGSSNAISKTGGTFGPDYSTILNGSNNSVTDDGSRDYGSILGGAGNTVKGAYSTIINGQNTLNFGDGTISYGPGISNIAKGSLVFADGSGSSAAGTLINNTTNFFLVRYAGGSKFITPSLSVSSADGNFVILSTSGVTISTSSGGIHFFDGTALYSTSSLASIGFVVDNFLSQANGSATSFVLSNIAVSTASLNVVLDGLLLSGTSDYTFSPPATITLATAPASNSTGFFAQYAVNAAVAPTGLAGIALLASTQTFTAPNTFTTTTTLKYVAGNGGITHSTFVYINSGSDSSLENVCIPGSTFTIVTNGNTVELSANLNFQAGAGSNSTIRGKFLRDGGFLKGSTEYSYIQFSNVSNFTHVGDTVQDNPSAGIHSYCYAVFDSVETQTVTGSGYFGGWERQ